MRTYKHKADGCYYLSTGMVTRNTRFCSSAKNAVRSFMRGKGTRVLITLDLVRSFVARRIVVTDLPALVSELCRRGLITFTEYGYWSAQHWAKPYTPESMAIAFMDLLARRAKREGLLK